MLRTRENSDIFNSLDKIYLVFISNKQISSINCKTKRLYMMYDIVHMMCKNKQCRETKSVYAIIWRHIEEDGDVSGVSKLGK